MSLKEQLAEYRAGWYQRVPAERQATCSVISTSCAAEPSPTPY